MSNQSGFSLLEAMIAVLVLAVGIIGAATMQSGAINSNTTAMNRTMANAVGRSFVEELLRVPFTSNLFNDTNNDGAAGLDNGSEFGGGILNPANADQQFNPVNFPTFVNTYTTQGNNVVDDSGRVYQLFWNIDRDPLVLGTPTVPYYRIHLFVYWTTPAGDNQHLRYTAMKYNHMIIFP